MFIHLTCLISRDEVLFCFLLVVSFVFLAHFSKIESMKLLFFRFGYKMRIFLYLNGDEESSNSFISLYWQLLPHEYDVILNWPFSARLSFTLLPINKCAPPILWSFNSNSETDFQECFRCPAGRPNDVFGISDFAPVSLIESEDYVKDDSLFVKIEYEG